MPYHYNQSPSLPPKQDVKSFSIKFLESGRKKNLHNVKDCKKNVYGDRQGLFRLASSQRKLTWGPDNSKID